MAKTEKEQAIHAEEKQEAISIETAKVIQGITIADHVRTGAGAVVVRDVEEAGTVVGVPARKIKQH